MGQLSLKQARKVFCNSCKSGAIYSLSPILKYSNALPELTQYLITYRKILYSIYTRKVHFFITI